jgi:hypothetical protein
MSGQTRPGAGEDDLSEADVDEYLRAHPDFFERHAGLLAILKLPHPTGGAVSLIERQVTVLRDKNRQLERKLMDLVQVARDNEQLSVHLHHLALGLIEADDLDAAAAIVQEQLRNEFKADAVVLRLLRRGSNSGSAHRVDDDEATLALFAELFKSRRAICGRLSDAQLAFLFADQAGEIGSAAAIPLCDANPLGVLALGSRDESRFHPGMGTLFLGYLGELVSRSIEVLNRRDV